MRKIGIMGGTFDPIHNGHLMLGRQAYREYGLDEVWYMPSRQPPHKSGRIITSSEDRCRMVQLAIAGIPYFVFSDFEIRRETGNTYTAETLRLLREKYPGDQLFFIVGADSLYEIEKWYHPEQVMAMATLLAAHRDYDEARISLERHAAYLRRTYGADIRLLHCPEMHVASEEIRQMALLGRFPSESVPPAVQEYIRAHHLYGAKEEKRHTEKGFAEAGADTSSHICQENLES